jgi:hypothetical protein
MIIHHAVLKDISTNEAVLLANFLNIDIIIDREIVYAETNIYFSLGTLKPNIVYVGSSFPTNPLVHGNLHQVLQWLSLPANRRLPLHVGFVYTTTDLIKPEE